MKSPLHPFSSHLAACVGLFALGASIPAQAAAPKEDRSRILLLDIAHNESVDAEEVKLLGDLLAVELSRYPRLDVMSGSDLRAMLEVEAKRQEVDCDMDASCLAELADALGARYVVAGRAGRVGQTVAFTVSLFDSLAARTISRADAVGADIEAVASQVRSIVDELLVPARGDIGDPGDRYTETVWDKIAYRVRQPIPLALLSTGGVLLAAGLATDVAVCASPIGCNGMLNGYDFIGPGVGAAGAGVLTAGVVALLFTADPEDLAASRAQESAQIEQEERLVPSRYARAEE